MVSYRLIIGIIVGICFSFLTVFFFNMDEVILRIELYMGSDPLKVIILMIGANFEFDIISYFANNPGFLEIFSPQILATIFIGYLCGTIVKGVKRSITASSLVIVVDFLIWMLLSVISGEDLMALFQSAQLSATIGGAITGIIGVLIGGLIGGLISGPFEDI